LSNLIFLFVFGFIHLIVYDVTYSFLTLEDDDRRLTTVPKSIEVVKISFPQGLILISRIQLRY